MSIVAPSLRRYFHSLTFYWFDSLRKQATNFCMPISHWSNLFGAHIREEFIMVKYMFISLYFLYTYIREGFVIVKYMFEGSLAS